MGKREEPPPERQVTDDDFDQNARQSYAAQDRLVQADMTGDKAGVRQALDDLKSLADEDAALRQSIIDNW